MLNARVTVFTVSELLGENQQEHPSRIKTTIIFNTNGITISSFLGAGPSSLALKNFFSIIATE